MRGRLWAVMICVGFVACGDGTTNPSGRSSLTISSVSPIRDTTITIPGQYPYNIPGGVVVPRGNGLMSVNMNLSVAADVPWAQLNVYLLTGGTTDQYCGQNLPDAPTWQFLTPGWKTTVSVSGFQIYRLPCDVTGLRAILHLRNNGLLTPPTGTEMIAETMFPTALHLVR